MRWQEVESQVRRIAESHWNAPCRAEDINGVRYDAIIRISPEEMVAIEITKEKNINKLRSDVTKLSSLRLHNFGSQIFTRCFFVTEGDSSSLKETGQGLHVTVLSAAEFGQLFLGSRDYSFQRTTKDFGSSVDPITGMPDTAKYTPISYIRDADSSRFLSSDMAQKILEGSKIVLLGEFGSGKSRCLREIFDKITEYSDILPTLAINLRENWGISTFDLIIRNHLGSMGLSRFADDMVKLVGQGRVRLLLDGFDEIGSQSWTGEAARLKEIRRKSLVGVRDLISRCRNAGLIIAGREHYFSSNEEMVDCLGLSNFEFDTFRCPDEFTDDEISDYIQSNTQLKSVPAWMPKKPLICQLFTKIDSDDFDRIVNGQHGEVEFFDNFLDALAKREQRIHGSIDPEILKGVLLNLAVRTRTKNDLEELSPAEINEAFYEVSGHTPLDESAVMLQRLPYLGRVGSGNPNRTFIDDYAKSGLRGLALIDALYKNDKRLLTDRWHKSVGDFGARVVASKVSHWLDARKFGKLCASHGNYQVMCDIFCAELEDGRDEYNFGGMSIENSFASTLDFGGKKVSGFSIDSCIVDAIELEDSELNDCVFSTCEFSRVSGVASKSSMPSAFDDSCRYITFTDIDASSRISSLPVSDKHKTLLMIIQKLFFQRGKGRKEEALLRGSSTFWDNDAASIAIRYMLKNDIIIEAPGRSGKLYIPQLNRKARMLKIKDGMSTSGDALWAIVAK